MNDDRAPIGFLVLAGICAVALVLVKVALALPQF